MSLAMRHKAKILGEAAATTAAVVIVKPSVNADAFYALRENLPDVLGTLKRLQGDEERTPYKQQLIEQYRDFANHTMTNFENWAGQTVLFWWLLWRMDVEGFTAVNDDFIKAIQHGLTTAESVGRDFAALYLTEMEDHYTEAWKLGDVDDISVVETAIEMIESGEIAATPVLKARVYKLYGHLVKKRDPETGLKAYLKAQELGGENIGVKKVVAELEKQLNGDSNE